MTTTGNILYDGDFVRTGIYTMNSGRGSDRSSLFRHRFFRPQGSDDPRFLDNQAADSIKPDTHANRHNKGGKFATSFFGTVGMGLAKVELSSYSGTIRILKRN